MNCFRFPNVINNSTIINTFNSDNSNIANINTQRRQSMTTITNKISKFTPIIKKPLVAGNTFFTVILYFYTVQFLHLNQFYGNKTFTKLVYQNQKTSSVSKRLSSR